MGFLLWFSMNLEFFPYETGPSHDISTVVPEKRRTQRVDTIHQGGVKGPRFNRFDASRTWRGCGARLVATVAIDFRFGRIFRWCNCHDASCIDGCILIIWNYWYMVQDCDHVSSPFGRLIVIEALLKDVIIDMYNTSKPTCHQEACFHPHRPPSKSSQLDTQTLYPHRSKQRFSTWTQQRRMQPHLVQDRQHLARERERQRYACAFWSGKLALAPKT